MARKEKKKKNASIKTKQFAAEPIETEYTCMPHCHTVLPIDEVCNRMDQTSRTVLVSTNGRHITTKH